MPTRKRPASTVDVLGRKFKVTRTPDAETSGFMSAPDARINVSPGQDDWSTKDAFLHEAMHAILYQQGIGTGSSDGSEQYDHEEKYVRSLSTGLIAFFRANPAVASWLISNPETI